MKKLTPWIFLKNLAKILRGRPQVPESLADQEIPDDIWAAILEAGRMAPSTVNLQTWSFCTFTEEQWQATFERGIPFGGRRAVIVLGDVSRVKEIIDIFPQSPLVEYTVSVLNASLAAMNMNIAAEALGISSVMLSETGKSGFFTSRHLQQALNLPAGVFPLMTIVFGYSKQSFAPLPPRLPMDQICASGKYPKADINILEDWLLEMKTAFKAARPLWSFEGQLRKYRDDIERAEEELSTLVYHEKTASSK